MHKAFVSGTSPRERLAPIEEAPSHEEEADFVNQSKARHRRRLRDRLRCKTKGHSYCYVDGSLSHTGLSNDDLEHWVDQLHDGHATLHSPPQQIVPVASRCLEPAESITSRNSHSYQRRFRPHVKPSLTDLRSWRSTLSLARLSPESSGIPGPGYLSGKAIKWVGECILDLGIPLEIRRRLWAIQRLLKRMEKQTDGTRRKWLLRNRESVYRLLGDLLELSSNDYQEKYRSLAKAHGARFRSSLVLSDSDDVESDSFYWAISSIASPLDFLSEDNSAIASFGISLRELLLQEHLDNGEIGQIIAELIVNACNEAAYGVSSASRCFAFRLLYRLYSSFLGKFECAKREKRGGLMLNLANKVFKQPIVNAAEQGSAVHFFVVYANDHPVYRNYLLGLDGLAALVSNLDAFDPADSQDEHLSSDWSGTSWICGALMGASDRDWAITNLLDVGICNALQKLLIHHHASGTPDEWIDYRIVCIFHNLITKGQERGQHKVVAIMTPQIRQILQWFVQKEWNIAWMAEGTHRRIHEIWAEINK